MGQTNVAWPHVGEPITTAWIQTLERSRSLIEREQIIGEVRGG